MVKCFTHAAKMARAFGVIGSTVDDGADGKAASHASQKGDSRLQADFKDRAGP